MQLLSTDRACTELQTHEGARVYRAKGGVIEVDSPRDAAILMAGGCTVRRSAPTGGRTFVCSCGFRSFFRDRCGRCGQTNLKEEI